MKGHINIEITKKTISVEAALEHVSVVDKIVILAHVMSSMGIKTKSERDFILDGLTSGILEDIQKDRHAAESEGKSGEDEDEPDLVQIARDLGLDVKDIAMGAVISGNPKDLRELLRNIVEDAE